ncbi:MAG: hypothetical protein F6K42_00765 [Leptolyngbya sp. SIO1D8]|nr:hypothetical protein [Leptolyngbya sp. SIO1D8]
MNIQNRESKLEKLSLIRERIITYFLELWDPSTGGFRFTATQPATLMATSYAILGLELINGLERLGSSQKNIVDYLMSNVEPDGSFVDPLFDIKDVLSEKHDLAYFQEETTTICQQALDALSAPPPPPRDWESDPRIKDDIIHYLNSLSWQDPWMDSNPVMFLLSQLCHDAERHNRPDLLQYVDAALDWLDAHQSPETGLWKGPYEVSLLNAMAATFHFTFFYFYRGRPIHYLEQIIDSCLSLQQSHGLFSQGSVIGQTCLDYDAIDLLAKASKITDYRKADVARSMECAHQALLDLYNAEDGGFADSKERLQPRGGRKIKLLKKLGLSKWISPTIRIPTKGTYHVCWKLLSCEKSQSNAFSTWFRMIGLYLTKQTEGLEDEIVEYVQFRRLPFLGHHILSK